ncbi:MAG: M3 family oligoendopeptidase [Termitinemataceae bacterium]|nr:MAG: M3 family oligoendopeptidase [Termitinemataceae bacterium]
MENTLPLWDLSAVYSSPDSVEFKRDLQLLKEKAAAFISLAERYAGMSDSRLDEVSLCALLDAFALAGDLAENLSAYTEALRTVNTADKKAAAASCAVDEAKLPLGRASVLLRNLLAKHKDTVLELAEKQPALKPSLFFIKQSIKMAEFQMEAAAEDLANDLDRCGAGAFSRLHDSLSSGGGTDQPGSKTLTELRSLAHHAERNVRESAYHSELQLCKSMEVPMAAALNSIKGWSITLDKRRGWKSPLEKAAFQARISEKTLDALIKAMESSLPMFMGYLKTKAALLKIEKCSFYDLFAPVTSQSALSNLQKKWTWDEACTFITERFAEFDPLMADFAKSAFAKNWIDARPRPCKIGGAYCTDFPIPKESRILCNFDGTFDSLSTVAHETGHAWHHEIVKDLSRLQSAYPMTLAETASTFAETLIFEGALKAAPPEAKLPLLEENIQNSCQLIVDILSRFYFEKALFEHRQQSELAPEEICALMLDAQKRTYGDSLNESELHPYMWAVKIHYYNQALAFYNFPYSFGCLFSLSLYNKAKAEGSQFAAKYRNLLYKTGMASAEEIAASAGFSSLEDGEFWNLGLQEIKKNIDMFTKLAKDDRGGN